MDGDPQRLELSASRGAPATMIPPGDPVSATEQPPESKVPRALADNRGPRLLGWPSGTSTRPQPALGFPPAWHWRLRCARMPLRDRGAQSGLTSLGTHGPAGHVGWRCWDSPTRLCSPCSMFPGGSAPLLQGTSNSHSFGGFQVAFLGGFSNPLGLSKARLWVIHVSGG